MLFVFFAMRALILPKHESLTSDYLHAKPYLARYETRILLNNMASMVTIDPAVERQTEFSPNLVPSDICSLQSYESKVEEIGQDECHLRYQ